MVGEKQKQPVYLLRLGGVGHRWRVALKTAAATHYFMSLEDLFLFLDRQSYLTPNNDKVRAHQQNNQ